MKKNLILIIVCLIIGIYIGYAMINSYKVENIVPISLNSKITKLYFIQVGVYSNKEDMKEKLSDLENYTYIKEKELYYAYVGITKNKKNKEKLKEYFNKLGYDIYVKEFDVENNSFNEVLSQYDNLLKETNDEKAIMTICNQVLEKYKELVVNAESKGNTYE